MIKEDFLKELGLNKEVIASIMEKLSEEEERSLFKDTFKKELLALKPQDEELVMKLLEEEIGKIKGNKEDIKKVLNAFKEKYPFLFKEDAPKIVSSTKKSNTLAKAEFDKMSYKEKTELYKRNPKLYKELANA